MKKRVKTIGLPRSTDGTRLLVHLVALALAVAGALSPPAHAVDPGRSLDQLRHVARTIEQGAPPDVWALAQTRDGFLWLGTGAGLYRFDGIRFEEVTPAGEAMPSRNITALSEGPDGSLWIGYYTGQISRLSGGKLQNFPSSDIGGSVHQFAFGRDKVVWAARSGTGHGLARLDNGRWRTIGEEAGLPNGSVYSIAAPPRGGLLVVTAGRTYALNATNRRFVPVGSGGSSARLIVARDGQVRLLSGSSASPPRLMLPGGGTVSVVALPRGSNAKRALIDRDGTIWTTEEAGGISRMVVTGRNGRPSNVERWDGRKGLTSDRAVAVFEDREGSIWVGTNLGLDQFRHGVVVPATRPDMSCRCGFEQVVLANGDVYVLANDGMLFRAVAGSALAPLFRLAVQPSFIAADGNRLLIEQRGRVAALVGSSLRPEPGRSLPGATVSWARDKAGRPWIAVAGRGIFRGDKDRWSRVSITADAATDARLHLASSDAGGEWFFSGDRLFRREAGTARLARLLRPNVGHINVVAALGDMVLVGGDFGLAVVHDRRADTLESRQLPVLAGLTGIAATSSGDIWLNGIRGVVRTTRADIRRAVATRGILRHRLFDYSDGLPGVAQQASSHSTAARSGDGRIWLVASQGVAWIDPRRLGSNNLPPEVVIRSVDAGARAYPSPARVVLPPGTRRMQIDYTALSLVDPTRNLFRYRLWGSDDGWIDASNRHQAVYTNLKPGRWSFQVIAANSDGVWNRRGATVEIEVRPSFHQTWWFAMLVGLMLLAAVWMMYRLRMRAVAGQMRDRLEARLGERTRIARELHDTLLQGMQGLMLRFQAVADALPPGTHELRMMEAALDRGDEVLIEGRDQVIGLREASAPALLHHELERLAASFAGEQLAIDVVESGKSRLICGPVVTEVVAIASEALANVERHADARHVSISIQHGHPLRVRIEDDGKGIAPAVLAAGGQPGHYGWRGMHERAAKIDGRIDLANLAGGGAAITLAVPAGTAYKRSRLKWLRRHWTP